ncbi:hypothetical protein HELRODRAFT_176351 [Helobdella robusta]|uniref:Uncharacterized protein n=1 Tax=Helobdella robusta TaxID=6412 RepID=T1FAF2_HELRO|nr:hypothetical protein HELRODRAFT_176351 [Helobdella robusta]ESO00043.1 hypothetical protein HELRODRAFT_176351 [Helobdella robusta]
MQSVTIFNFLWNRLPYSWAGVFQTHAEYFNSGWWGIEKWRVACSSCLNGSSKSEKSLSSIYNNNINNYNGQHQQLDISVKTFLYANETIVEDNAELRHSKDIHPNKHYPRGLKCMNTLKEEKLTKQRSRLVYYPPDQQKRKSEVTYKAKNIWSKEK